MPLKFIGETFRILESKIISGYFEAIRISGKCALILMSHLIEQLSFPFIRLQISMEVKHKHTFHQGGKNESERHHKIPINRIGITDSRQRRVRRSQKKDNGQDGCFANSHSSVHVLVTKHKMQCEMLIYPILIFIGSKEKEQP